MMFEGFLLGMGVAIACFVVPLYLLANSIIKAQRRELDRLWGRKK